jgi:putative exporter of polyketide antibiotics
LADAVRSGRRALALIGAVVVGLGACTPGPTIRPSGSPVAFAVVAQLNGPATAVVTVTDRSGLVVGVTSLDRATESVSTDESGTLLDQGYLVRAVADTSDLELLWTSGVCYPVQTLDVTGTARHLDVRVRLIPPLGDGTCELVGGGPAIRLSLAVPVLPVNVAVSVVSG